MPNPLQKLKRDLGLDGGRRREPLIQKMATDEAAGLHCASCEGVCCTFVANSMQITPVEALELAVYLDQNDRLGAAMIEGLRENVRRFRLDREPPGDGRRDYVRRTYTCPFFESAPKGCTISRIAKPYGCLGFNPNDKDLVIGGDCDLDTALMTSREDAFRAEEARLNQELGEALDLGWEKLPIPMALLDLLAKLDMI